MMCCQRRRASLYIMFLFLRILQLPFSSFSSHLFLISSL
ncbi:unnamed protein product [Brassica rapa subsp. narinosa]